jgi:DNA-binding NtrC family response regulator
MSLAAQVRLLRVLQEKEFIPVGSTTPRKTDVRLIAATNRILADEVKNGRFREDLYYRLNVIEIHLPSLRERRDDIPLLIKHFLQKCDPRQQGERLRISEGAVARLVRHDWPGNVRELENVIERSVALCESDVIEISDFPANLQQEAEPSLSSGETYSHLSLQEARETFEQGYIAETPSAQSVPP